MENQSLSLPKQYQRMLPILMLYIHYAVSRLRSTEGIFANIFPLPIPFTICDNYG